MTDDADRAAWRPVEDLAPEFRRFAHDGAREAAVRWRASMHRLENSGIDTSPMDIWFRSMRRIFAIETGQLAGLYALRSGAAETLIAEGFGNVRGAHARGQIDDGTLAGLLAGQEAALNALAPLVKMVRPPTAAALKEWHALLTEHQHDEVRVDTFGNRAVIPLRRGRWRNRPYAGRGGVQVQACCPPDAVGREMDRLLSLHWSHAGLGLTPEMEAAWLHREFFRIRPFQVGNGRIARLLVACVYAMAGEIPPVIPSESREHYAGALERAARGDLGSFARFLGDLAAAMSKAASARAKIILSGDTDFRHSNGGVTSRGVYYPPNAHPPPS
ncbi:MAG: Fic family protein [Rhodospirillaceae bacterium]|nr:Fic family protein [Rhodospirillaceae bacterium]